MEHGINGATAASLNDRFVKCAGCKVNIPKEDLLALGKCTVCGRKYEESEPSASECVSFSSVQASGPSSCGSTLSSGTETKRKKRWVVMVSKRGREYYHNTENGEDRWDKPADFDADASEDRFVPFKNDVLKNAVLREQAKLDAKKMGIPISVLEKHRSPDDDEILPPPPVSVTAPTPSAVAAPMRTPASPQQAAASPCSSSADERHDSPCNRNTSCGLM